MLSPLPVPRPNPWAVSIAAFVNASVLALLLLLGLHTFVPHNGPQQHHAPIDLGDIPFLAFSATQGGQGGGQHNALEATRGHLPPIAPSPLTPPQIPVIDHPRLAIDNTITAPASLRLQDDPSLTSIGLPHSSNTIVISGGRGSRGGIGDGDDAGAGNGHGIGFGPGSGDAIYTPGIGGVSLPVAVFTPEPEFSDEARLQKYQGICMIAIIVDTHGNPLNPRVIRHLGMGLDEKALDAVRRYRFRPALRNGKPVSSAITVAIDFRLVY